MRILIINQHMDNILGGSEIQCDLIANNLKNFGHEITYGAINSVDKHEREYNVYPIKKLSIKSFIHILNEIKPDVVYWRYNKKFFLISSFICRLKKCKFVFSISHVNDVTKWVNNSKIYDENLIKKIKKYFYNKFKMMIGRINYYGYYFTDGVVSLKEDLLSYIPKNISKENKIHIYNSMNLKIRNEFKWNKPYIVWVANIKKSKNPEMYIELARKFEDKDLDFIMIGKIQDKAYDYILDINSLPKNVHYLGLKTVSEVDEILDKSLFMVHTCNPEGFGNNFIQSWLSGKPTISLYFDPDNIIQDNNIGYVSGTLEQMQSDVRKLIENNELRSEMGNKAKHIAQELFNPYKNAKKLEVFLDKIVNSR